MPVSSERYPWSGIVAGQFPSYLQGQEEEKGENRKIEEKRREAKNTRQWIAFPINKPLHHTNHDLTSSLLTSQDHSTTSTIQLPVFRWHIILITVSKISNIVSRLTPIPHRIPWQGLSTSVWQGHSTSVWQGHSTSVWREQVRQSVGEDDAVVM